MTLHMCLDIYTDLLFSLKNFIYYLRNAKLNTSLQYWSKTSLNFIIICLLMVSRVRMCLKFNSMSNAASADRRVLKDSSIKFLASSSIT